jgi:hypothetical protein
MPTLSSDRRFVSRVLLVALLLSLAAFILGGAQTSTVLASGSPSAQTQSGRLAPSGNIVCASLWIQVVNNRIAVNCANSVGAIHWFAASTTTSDSAALADRFLVLLNTAYALGKSPLLWYTDDSTQNPAGCSVSDCRRLDQVVLQ